MKPQVIGKAIHKSIENQTYSDTLNILMDFAVYVEKYKLFGITDIFDIKKGLLIERKRRIARIYDGYVFQVYAHYFGLCELGYKVNEIRLYDFSANKKYPIALPQDDLKLFKKFENLIRRINNYNMNDSKFQVKIEKCTNCIYSNLCDKAALC